MGLHIKEMAAGMVITEAYQDKSGTESSEKGYITKDKNGETTGSP